PCTNIRGAPEARDPGDSLQLEEFLALPPVLLLFPFLVDALLQQVADQEGQSDRRVDQALRHLRVLVELAPGLTLLERAAAQAPPLRHVDRSEEHTSAL